MSDVCVCTDRPRWAEARSLHLPPLLLVHCTKQKNESRGSSTVPLLLDTQTRTATPQPLLIQSTDTVSHSKPNPAVRVTVKKTGSSWFVAHYAVYRLEA